MDMNGKFTLYSCHETTPEARKKTAVPWVCINVQNSQFLITDYKEIKEDFLVKSRGWKDGKR